MNKLLVYFSYTGNTKMIANKIKEKLNCDILEIKTVIPYSNDLSGKTIKPFATNAGWLGKTFKEIRTLCPNSEICEGMNIVFESYSEKLVTKEQDIENWIKTL